MNNSPAPEDKHADDAPPATFESSLAELQQIAQDLEDGSLGLEESLQRFERGIALLRQCYKTLEQAEQRIEILTGFDAAGNAVTAPFDASATVEQAKAPSAGKRKRRRNQPDASAGGSSEETESDESDPETRLF